MKTESDVIEKFSQDISNRLVRSCIRDLKKIKDCLSSDDTELENAWEEICIQVQIEESLFWESYDSLVTDIISRYTSKLKPHEILAIWFQTDEGNDWLCTPVMSQEYYETQDFSNIDGFRVEGENPPVCIDDITKYFQQSLYEQAEIYSNRRIRNFFKRY